MSWRNGKLSRWIEEWPDRVAQSLWPRSGYRFLLGWRPVQIVLRRFQNFSRTARWGFLGALAIILQAWAVSPEKLEVIAEEGNLLTYLVPINWELAQPGTIARYAKPVFGRVYSVTRNEEIVAGWCTHRSEGMPAYLKPHPAGATVQFHRSRGRSKYDLNIRKYFSIGGFLIPYAKAQYTTGTVYGSR